MRQILENKVAVVTGGSRGIGRSVANALAEKGAKVLICSRTKADLKATCRGIIRSGGECRFIQVDVADESDVDELLKYTLSCYQGVDYLINNAGVGIYKKLVDCSSSEWDLVMNTNLKGVFYCSRAFIPKMIQQGKGCIVNVASTAGRTGLSNLSLYCASKFGIIGLSEALRKELAPHGIDVLYLCPSYVRTAFFEDFPDDFSIPTTAASPDSVAQDLLELLLSRHSATATLRKECKALKKKVRRILLR